MDAGRGYGWGRRWCGRGGRRFRLYRRGRGCGGIGRRYCGRVGRRRRGRGGNFDQLVGANVTQRATVTIAVLWAGNAALVSGWAGIIAARISSGAVLFQGVRPGWSTIVSQRSKQGIGVGHIPYGREITRVIGGDVVAEGGNRDALAGSVWLAWLNNAVHNLHNTICIMVVDFAVTVQSAVGYSDETITVINNIATDTGDEAPEVVIT